MRTNAKVFILAAGAARRFNGVLKQILPIGKETILQRITRQVVERNTNAPFVVTTHTELIDYCVKSLSIPIYRPINYSVTCETFLDTSQQWKEKNIILLGDVIYSKAAIDSIFEASRDNDKTLVFGDHWEVFAVVFPLSDSVNVKKALMAAIKESPGKVRHFYKIYCGFDPDQKDKPGIPLEDKVFRYIRDWTRDIDMLSQYNNALRELVMRSRLD